MNAFVVRGLYVSFYFNSSKVFVFVDAHGSRVEDTTDVSLYFMENKVLLLPTSVLYITASHIVNTNKYRITTLKLNNIPRYSITIFKRR